MPHDDAHVTTPGELPAVLLVAHGSARSRASAEPVLALARALSGRGFPEVRTAFWKEEPFLHQALDTVRSAGLVVLPVFLAEGYFGRVVVPRELGLPYGLSSPSSQQLSRWGPHRAHVLPPLGTDPALDDLVLDRGRTALPTGAAADDALLVVLGHGTPRDPGSADTVLATCARLAERSGFARVAPAFIDQEPRLESVLANAAEATVVVVPFLVAAGFHGGDTVPEELRAAREVEHVAARTARAARRIAYGEPVGTHPALAELVDRIVRDARFDQHSDEPQPPRPEAPLSLLEASLADRIARAGSVTFLQVEIRGGGDDAYLLRHVADTNAEAGALVETADPDALVALSRRTATGEHRPLRTTADLPAGWRHRARGIRAAVEALIALYGPAITHWHLGERGELGVRSFADVAARQSGTYARLMGVEPGTVAEGVRRCCDGLPCLRARMWEAGDPPPNAVAGPDGHPETEGGARLVVPCPAPCPILLGTILESGLESG